MLPNLQASMPCQVFSFLTDNLARVIRASPFLLVLHSSPTLLDLSRYYRSLVFTEFFSRRLLGATPVHLTLVFLGIAHPLQVLPPPSFRLPARPGVHGTSPPVPLSYRTPVLLCHSDRDLPPLFRAIVLILFNFACYAQLRGVIASDLSRMLSGLVPSVACLTSAMSFFVLAPVFLPVRIFFLLPGPRPIASRRRFTHDMCLPLEVPRYWCPEEYLFVVNRPSHPLGSPGVCC